MAKKKEAKKQIVWELKDGNVLIRDQKDKPPFDLRVEFSASTQGFRDALRVYRVALRGPDDESDRKYLVGVADAIRQAREAWHRANGTFNAPKPKAPKAPREITYQEYHRQWTAMGWGWSDADMI